MNEFHQRLKKLLMERCGVSEEKIRPEANLQADLGLDSMDAVELAIAIEDEFDVTIFDEDMRKLSTVAEAAALIKRLIDQKATTTNPPPAASAPSA